MSQNVQMAALLMPVQPVLKQSVRSSLNTNQESSYENSDTPEINQSSPIDSDLQPDAKKVGFDQVLNSQLEKRQDSAEEKTLQQPALQQIEPAFSALLSGLLVQNDMQGSNPITQAAIPLESGNTVPQPAAPASVISIASSTTAVAAVQPATSEGLADTTAHPQIVLTAKNTEDKMLSDEAIRSTPNSQFGLPVQKAAETVEAGNIIENQPDEPNAGIEKPISEKMPVLPEQAIQNTADKPAAVKSPVLAGQTRPVAEDEAIGQAAPKLRGDLKIAYHAKSTGSAVRKADSPKGQGVMTLHSGPTGPVVNGYAAGQIEPKNNDLNISEVKVLTQNAGPQVRPADAIASSRPAEQIAQSLPAGPARADQQIRLTLTPPELGTVRITFREQDGEIVGLVEAQKAETRRELEDSLPQLISAMQNQGLGVRRVEVLQWNPPHQGARDPLSENPSTEREFLQQGASQQNERSPKNGDSSPEAFEGQAKQAVIDTPDSRQWFSDKGLNLYI